MMIDAHHHLWDTAVREYAWMDGPWADPLRGRFDVERYAGVAKPHGVTGSIVVQALHSLAETRELLATADAKPIEGVVGWIDLTTPDVADTIAALSGPLVGIRHQVQDEPDPDWLARPDVRRGLRAVGEAGLVYDLLVKPPQADAALAVAEALPEVSFVLDHAGKPDIAGGVWEPWASWIMAMAGLPNVTVKLSGLVTEAESGWKSADILPYARHVVDAFGPGRVMYGSDWPVCTLAASYGQVLELAEAALDGLSETECAEVFGGTASRVYGIGG
ncbi:amidohydrolase family protein [Actinomadura rudentiformis]|uniref:Amidohydrolase family protein n=1 Tax=Actinomadura rudentiformis TaxID=359158 RepID=A0A6H9YYV2_9ACTN|nr:amidohydrolase family protein [Actinomadura rudentiformis]KAB2346480.1 amidohydrolase family protein [Actinomadura rudentiformis]